MQKREGIKLPPESDQLAPFAAIFVDIVVAEAGRASWLDSSASPPKHELNRISGRIQSEITRQWHRELHPAIWIHALLVCAHFFHQSTRNAKHSEMIDEAFCLLQFLKLHHGLYDLYLLIS